jgi:phage/plasmid-like protein (TIGR03299 family)
MSKHAVAYRKEDGQPWIGLPGTATEGEDIDAMFNAAKLGGWNVRPREVVTDARTDKPDFEIIRDNPDDGLLDRMSMMKARYTPVQNEDIKGIALGITSGDIKPVAMGQYDGGRKVFMSFELGESIVLDPQGQADEIGRFLTFQTSHDGSLSIIGHTGNLRIRCQNMLTSMRAAALSSFKFRHTATVEGRLLDARAALGLAFKESEVFAKEMQTLIEQSMTDQKFWELVTAMDPMPEKDVRGSVKKWETRTDLAMALWRGEADGGDTVDNLAKTKYRAYNALNERLMWYTSIRDSNVSNALVKASGFDDFTNKRNLDLYKAVANA